MHSIKWVGLFLLVGLFHTGYGQDTIIAPVYDPGKLPEVHHFSLKQVLAYAEKNNVQVKNALLDVSLQEQVNKEVTGRAYPHIMGSANLTYNPGIMRQRIPNFFAPGVIGVLAQYGVKDKDGNPIVFDPNFDYGYIEMAFGTPWTSNAGVSLSQLLFDGQVFTGLQARKTLIDFQKKNIEVTWEQVQTNITKIYYQLVVSRTQIALLDTNIALVRKLQHDMKIMYDNGFAEKLDIDKQTVQLANLQSTKTNVLNQIINGYTGLKVLMGMPVNDQLVLTDRLTDDMIKAGILEALDFDYRKRKDYQYALLGEKLGEYDIQRYKLSKIPTLSLSSNYTKMAQRESLGGLFKSQWFGMSSVAVGLQIPIFNGFATNALIQEARIKLQKTQNQLEALKLNIDREINTSVNDFRAALQNLDFQKDNMELATRIYNQTKKKYEIGTGSQLEINSARADLEKAQANYYDALYKAVVARVDFLKATGKL